MALRAARCKAALLARRRVVDVCLDHGLSGYRSAHLLRLLLLLLLRHQVHMVDPVLTSHVAGQGPCHNLLPTHVAFNLPPHTGFPINDVNSREVGPLAEPRPGLARKKHFWLCWLPSQPAQKERHQDDEGVLKGLRILRCHQLVVGILT